MKDEWEVQLQEKFSFMKQSRVDEETNVYRRWGCECSGGWYRLLYDLCQEITDRYAEDGLEVDIVVRQVKEKMESLRFYYTYEDITDKSKQSLRDDVARIVHSYEEKSKTICEICGQDGDMRMDMMRKKTLCDRCYSNYLQKIRERMGR